MLKPYGYFNGKIMKVSAARIAPQDLGVLRGYGAFDFYRTFDGKPFLLKQHTTRFHKSIGTLGLKYLITEKELEKITVSLLAKNKIKDGFFRMVLTGGASDNGIDIGQPYFYILAYDAICPPKELYESGASLMTFDHQRLYPEAKTNNYITAVRLQNERKKKSAIEILYTNKGKVLECSTCNVFIVKNKKLITPKSNILTGTTRNFVIKITGKVYKVEERDVTVKELFSADECFISSTTKDVLPIVKIDGKKIGNGKVGEVTRNVMELFKKAHE